MSIATLKKKTMHKYNNSSVGHGQFSLNGGHRSQGYIGQTSSSRSLIRTPMKGNTVKGSGGINGTYPQQILFSSDVSSLNDSSHIKRSVVSTNGMIKEKYRWIRRPLPFSVFKPKKIDECKYDIVKDKIVTSCSRVAISYPKEVDETDSLSALENGELQNGGNINCRVNTWDKIIYMNRKITTGTTSMGIKESNGLTCED